MRGVGADREEDKRGHTGQKYATGADWKLNTTNIMSHYNQRI